MIGSDTHFRDEFLAGAARALFVSAYADYVEDGKDGEGSDDMPRPGPGEDWADFAPAAPPAAYALAGELWASLECANGCSVYSLAATAEAADGREVDVDAFGFDLAMQWMGSGVSWFDNHKKFPLQVSYKEVSGHTFSEAAYRGAL